MFNRFILNRAQFITCNTIKEPLKCVSGNFFRRTANTAVFLGVKKNTRGPSASALYNYS